MPPEIALDDLSVTIQRFEAALQDNAQALYLRDVFSNSIAEGQQYSLPLHWERSKVYEALGFPDLAVMDAYKASLLLDELQDEDAEYHEQTKDAMHDYLQSLTLTDRRGYSWCKHVKSLDKSMAENITQLASRGSFDEVISVWMPDLLKEAPLEVARNLATIGCLRAAWVYVDNVLKLHPDYVPAITERDRIAKLIDAHFSKSKNGTPRTSSGKIDVMQLPDQGYVRREVYPWNNHEADRHSSAALASLNAQIAAVAPKLEVRVTQLPALATESGSTQSQSVSGSSSTVLQLGTFAKEDIAPGELVLTERSMLTANARLHEPMCDACSALLPDVPMGTDSRHADGGPIACSDCDDTVFCSRVCLDLAQASYHPAVCGADVEALAKDVSPTEAATALYTQLLFRALSMAQTQNLHPLDLNEVKYIWGDFTSSHLASPKGKTGAELFHSRPRTLPFTFNAQVLQPIHFLLGLDLSPFASGPLGETWVYNTLYGKFRGTASARISERDGRPEVAAVHPLWCLANHSCDPGVEWNWAGEIKFYCRRQRVVWKRGVSDATNTPDTKQPNTPGIKKDEEVFSHYVDLGLGVKDRREWAVGSLGGDCQCERCLWESQDQ